MFKVGKKLGKQYQLWKVRNHSHRHKENFLATSNLGHKKPNNNKT